MSIVEKLITEQNQYDLFYNILLSVKSKNPSVVVDEELSKGICKLESTSIPIAKTDDVKSEMSSFSISIKRERIPKIFSKDKYKYDVKIDGNNRGYSSFKKMYFNSDSISDRCSKVIGDIFDYLLDIDERKKIEKTNNTVLDIISDISTTIDKSYRRDNRIDEVLNNN